MREQPWLCVPAPNCAWYSDININCQAFLMMLDHPLHPTMSTNKESKQDLTIANDHILEANVTNKSVSHERDSLRGRLWRVVVWIPPRCRWEEENPPKFTLGLNLLFGLVSWLVCYAEHIPHLLFILFSNVPVLAQCCSCFISFSDTYVESWELILNTTPAAFLLRQYCHTQTLLCSFWYTRIACLTMPMIRSFARYTDENFSYRQLPLPWQISITAIQFWTFLQMTSRCRMNVHHKCQPSCRRGMLLACFSSVHLGMCSNVEHSCYHSSALQLQ